MTIEPNTPIPAAQFASMSLKEMETLGVGAKSAFLLKALGQHAQRAGEETVVTLHEEENPVLGKALELVSFKTSGNRLGGQFSQSQRKLFEAGRTPQQIGIPYGKEVKEVALDLLMNHMPASFSLEESPPHLQFGQRNLIANLKNNDFLASLEGDSVSYLTLPTGPGGNAEIVAITLECGLEPSEGSKKIMELAGLNDSFQPRITITKEALHRLTGLHDQLIVGQRQI